MSDGVVQVITSKFLRCTYFRHASEVTHDEGHAECAPRPRVGSAGALDPLYDAVEWTIALRNIKLNVTESNIL